jgi:hypothetical protein
MIAETNWRKQMKSSLKRLVIAASAMMIAPAIAIAQTSAPSSNPSAHSQPSTSPQQPVGASMSGQGNATPCSTHASGTSDRTGGNGATSTVSGGANSNPGGSVKTGGC